MFTKIEEADLLNKGNVGMPDTPNLTTAEMQAKMDELSRDVIIPKFNNLVEELSAESAAEHIGIVPPENFIGNTLQALIVEMALIVLENQLKKHEHLNKEDLDAITKQNMESWNKLVELFGNVTGVADSITDSTTSIPNSHAIVEYVKALGAGDMQKAIYDTDNSGVVDDAEKLGGNSPDAFQMVFDELLNTMAKTIPGAINEVLSKLGDVSALATGAKTSVVDAVNEVHYAIPEMLESLEEVEANNESGKVADALTVKEINNNLGGLRFGVDGDGNYGYYGADGSLVPFKSGGGSFTVTTYVASNASTTYNRQAMLDAGYTKLTVVPTNYAVSRPFIIEGVETITTSGTYEYDLENLTVENIVFKTSNSYSAAELTWS